MDGKGSVTGAGPWAPSINDGPHLFSQGVVFFDCGEGEVGDATLLGS